MSAQRRRDCLAKAGWNVLNLDAADVDIDLYSDVPHESLLPKGELGFPSRREPDLQSVASALYGPARYFPTSKGRGACFSLAVAIAAHLQKPRWNVITHGLFRTTARQLGRQGGQLELAPLRAPGSCDLDLAWVEQRLGAGGVDLIHLEPANNSIGGWPLSLENLTQLRALADRHGCLLGLDATRLLGNCAASGGRLPGAAHAFTALADFFTVSCAKELLVPHGALVAVRTLEMQRAAFFNALTSGIWLDPLEARIELARGLSYVTQHPELFVRQRERLLSLTAALKARAIPVLEPLGAHAVYVPIDALLAASPGATPHALEALLYQHSGLRASIGHSPALGAHFLRLIFPLDPSPLDRGASAIDVGAIAEACHTLFQRAAEAPRLVEEHPSRSLHEVFIRYAPPQGDAVYGSDASDG